MIQKALKVNGINIRRGERRVGQSYERMAEIITTK